MVVVAVFSSVVVTGWVSPMVFVDLLWVLL